MRENSDRTFWRCDCGKKYKSELALNLCEERRHKELVEAKIPESEFNKYYVEPYNRVEDPNKFKKTIIRTTTEKVKRTFVCMDCKKEFNTLGSRGAFPVRCFECKREMRRKSSKLYKASVIKADPKIRSFECLDCKEKFPFLKNRGTLPIRCYNCKKTRLLDFNKQRYRKLAEQNKCISCGGDKEEEGRLCNTCKEKRKISKLKS